MRWYSWQNSVMNTLNEVSCTSCHYQQTKDCADVCIASSFFLRYTLLTQSTCNVAECLPKSFANTTLNIIRNMEFFCSMPGCALLTSSSDVLRRLIPDTADCSSSDSIPELKNEHKVKMLLSHCLRSGFIFYNLYLLVSFHYL